MWIFTRHCQCALCILREREFTCKMTKTLQKLGRNWKSAWKIIELVYWKHRENFPFFFCFGFRRELAVCGTGRNAPTITSCVRSTCSWHCLEADDVRRASIHCNTCEIPLYTLTRLPLREITLIRNCRRRGCSSLLGKSKWVSFDTFLPGKRPEIVQSVILRFPL